MGSPPVTPKEKERYIALRREGWSIREAAQRVGRSYTWARDFEKGRTSEGEAWREERRDLAMPQGPLQLHELSPIAADCRNDFGRFRARYLGRISSPWQEDAAHQVVQKLETPYKEYIVCNCPPGGGKTTTFTHDLPAWITARNRAIRGCLGHAVQRRADEYTGRLKRTFERRLPQQASHDLIARGLAIDAEASLVADYGPFKPDNPDIWTRSQFTVAQLGETSVDEKESTWVAFGQDTGFLGYRVDFINWDDLVNRKVLRSMEAVEAQRLWWDTEAETRLEPHGLLLLVGQRLASHDLYRYCLDKKTGIEELEVDEDPDPELAQKYFHVVYRAHYESLCRADEDPSVHRWDAQPYNPSEPEAGGCLLDPVRLSWRELRNAQAAGAYQTVYQQEDVDPSHVLVQQIWIDGGKGTDGVDYPGCWDHDRDLAELPNGLDGYKLSVVTCDPSPTQFWSVQHWLYNEPSGIEPNAGFRYLIDHERRKMDAPDFLDWSPGLGVYTGLLEDWWQRARDMGIPFTHLILEANAAQRYMLQYEFFKRWAALRGVHLIPHQTQRNKLDPDYGIQTVAQHWRYGRIRLPGGRRLGGRFASLRLTTEVTRWPDSATDDAVLAHWFMEYHLPRIRMANARIGSIYDDQPSWMRRTAGVA